MALRADAGPQLAQGGAAQLLLVQVARHTGLVEPERQVLARVGRAEHDHARGGLGVDAARGGDAVDAGQAHVHEHEVGAQLGGRAHTLITAARRHTREMAVLAAIGATPRQVRGMLAVLGGAIVAPALALGVPVGLAAARLLWWRVATSIGVGGDLTPPVGLLTGTVAGVFVLALLLALAPGLRATRESAVIRPGG